MSSSSFRRRTRGCARDLIIFGGCGYGASGTADAATALHTPDCSPTGLEAATTEVDHVISLRLPKVTCCPGVWIWIMKLEVSAPGSKVHLRCPRLMDHLDLHHPSQRRLKAYRNSTASAASPAWMSAMVAARPARQAREAAKATQLSPMAVRAATSPGS